MPSEQLSLCIIFSAAGEGRGGRSTCLQGQSGHDLLKFFEKGAWTGSRDPLNFWALSANSSKTVKATDFKFDTHVCRDSPVLSGHDPLKFFAKGRGYRYVTP